MLESKGLTFHIKGQFLGTLVAFQPWLVILPTESCVEHLCYEIPSNQSHLVIINDHNQQSAMKLNYDTVWTEESNVLVEIKF